MYDSFDEEQETEEKYEPELFEIDHTCTNCNYEWSTGYKAQHVCKKCGCTSIERYNVIG